jgi:YggT family protein
MQLVVAGLRAYALVIAARAVLSWLPPPWRENDVYRFSEAITEPVLRPLRRALPPWGAIDYSPIIAVVVLELLARSLAGV